MPGTSVYVSDKIRPTATRAGRRTVVVGWVGEGIKKKYLRNSEIFFLFFFFPFAPTDAHTRGVEATVFFFFFEARQQQYYFHLFYS